MDAKQTLQQAAIAHQQGRLADAEVLYRQVLQKEPANAAALHHLGLIASASGHHRPAMDLVGQSLKLAPNNVDFRANMISVLDAAGFKPTAEAAAKQLVLDFPNDLKLRARYARLLHEYEKYSLSAKEWETIDAAAPGDPSVLFHFALALERTGDVVNAEKQYRRCIEAKPNFGEPMINLSTLCQRLGRAREARELLRDAIERLPNDAKAIAAYGTMLMHDGQIEQAEKHFARALELAPHDADVLSHAGGIHSIRGEPDLAYAKHLEVIKLKPKNAAANSTAMLSSCYLIEDGVTELATHRGFQTRVGAHIKANPPKPRVIADGERIRIGYVSPDFRMHPVGFFIAPLLAHHDRSRFEIHCFSNSPVDDPLSRQIRDSVEHFHAIEPLTTSLDAFEKRIRDTNLDILIDLAGHTGANVLHLFARKPVAFQATYLGYPHTTGLDAIDVRITDAVADPVEYADAHHSERLVRMPHSFGLFAPPPGAPEVAPAPHEINRYVTIGTIGRIEKWSPATIKSWAAILAAVPDARFRLMGTGFNDPSFQARLLDRLSAAGIARERIELIGSKPFAEYLAEVSKTDLLLDPWPFNNHTTTLQAMYMGVPTVTLAGRAHRSRMGTSIMTAAGLPELIAQTTDQYEQIAIDLARHPERLTQLRTTMRQRMLASPLCDAVGFARAFEERLVAAWREKMYPATVAPSQKG